MRSRRLLLLVFCALVFLLDGPAPARAQGAGASSVQVSVNRLARTNIEVPIAAFGTVEPLKDVEVAADSTAQVLKVLFKEGDTVEAGQALVELDDKSTGLRVLRAAQVLSRVEAALRQAERAFERRRQLVDKGIMSRAALDTAKTNLETAKARVGEAQSSLRLAERDDTNRDIVSPVSGKVASQDVEPGELVQPGTVIARVQAAQIVRIVTYLSERDIGLIKAGGPAQVRVPAVPGQAFSARVESVGIQADEATGNFPVKLVVENADGLLRAGMTARVRFQDIVLPDQLVLPQRALINRNLRRVVFVVANGKAVRREPVLRAGFSDKLVVISGLEPGETVIVEGHDAVVDGTLVSISDEASK